MKRAGPRFPSLKQELLDRINSSEDLTGPMVNAEVGGGKLVGLVGEVGGFKPFLEFSPRKSGGFMIHLIHFFYFKWLQTTN